MRQARATLLLLAFVPLVMTATPKGLRPNGLLLSGTLAGAYGGVGWQRVFEHYDNALIRNTSRLGRAWELDFPSVGIGYHWGANGVLVTGTLSLAETGLSGDYAFMTGPVICLHAVHGATRGWVNREPVIDAFVGYAPLEMCGSSHLVAGIESRWRFFVVSPKLRAQWLWYFTDGTINPDWSNTHTISLSAGIELGGIWALGL